MIDPEEVRRYLDRRAGEFVSLIDETGNQIGEAARAAGVRIMDSIEQFATDEDTYIRLLQVFRRDIRASLTEWGLASSDAAVGARERAIGLALDTASGAFRNAAAVTGRIDLPDVGEIPIEVRGAVLDYLETNPLDGIPLSERIWNVMLGAEQNIIRRTRRGVLQGERPGDIARDIRDNLIDPDGRGARELATIKGLRTRARRAKAAGDTDRAVRLYASARRRQAALQAIGKGVYRSATMNVMRVVRSELVRAHQEAAWNYGQRRGWVVGYYWYPNPEACSICVAMEGHYRKDAAPSFPHPQCGCRLEPVADPAITGEAVREWRDVPAGVSGEARRTYWTAKAIRQARGK